MGWVMSYELWVVSCESPLLSERQGLWELLKKLSWNKPLTRLQERMFLHNFIIVYPAMSIGAGGCFMNYNATLCSTA